MRPRRRRATPPWLCTGSIIAAVVVRSLTLCGVERGGRLQHKRMEATLARHEKSIEETKAAVYNTQAAANSISRRIEQICHALPHVDSDAEYECPSRPGPDGATLLRRGGPKEADSACHPQDKMPFAAAEARRRPADAGAADGAGGRGTDADEAQRRRVEQNAVGQRPAQVPALDWGKHAALMGGNSRGIGRVSARSQTSQGGRQASARGGYRDDASATSPRGSDTFTPRTDTLRTESQLLASRQVACVCGVCERARHMRARIGNPAHARM